MQGSCLTRDQPLPESGDEQSGVEAGEQERLLADGLERHLKRGGILLPLKVPGVARGGERESERDGNVAEDGGCDGRAEEHGQRYLSGAAELRAGGGGFAQSDARVEPGVDDEDARGGLQCAQGPEPPAPARDGARGGEAGGDGGRGERGGAGDLEERGALAVFQVDEDGEAAEGGDARADGEEGPERPGGEEDCDAGDENGAPADEPASGGGGFRAGLLPDEALAHEQDGGVLGGHGGEGGGEDGKLAPMPGASEEADGDDGGEQHGGGAVLAGEIQFGALLCGGGFCRDGLREGLHRCLSGPEARGLTLKALPMT